MELADLPPNSQPRNYKWPDTNFSRGASKPRKEAEAAYGPVMESG